MLRADGGPGPLPGPPVWGSPWEELPQSPSYSGQSQLPQARGTAFISVPSLDGILWKLKVPGSYE